MVVTWLARVYGNKMKNTDALARALMELVQAHYYSEDFELASAVRAFQEGLAPPERDELKGVVLQRLIGEGSMVDILLCSVVPVASAGPVLARLLNQESVPSQLTRTLIVALQMYTGDEAYRAVERFVDSDQEGEALAALARMDFPRTLHYLARALERPSALGPILHIFHARAKEVGVPALALELKTEGQRYPATFREGVARALVAKPERFNPFTPVELERLQRELR